MAATIQTIEKPTRARALDTSGNNNHGQIYSGRALEFDGVSDYLDPPNAGSFSSANSVSFFNGNTSDSNFVTNASGNVVPVQATTCMWLYTKSFADTQYVQESGGGEWSIYIQTTGKIQVGYLSDNYGVDSSNDSPRYITNSKLELNTWYRLVVVWNMQEGTSSEVFKVYINGVLDTGGTSNEMGATGNRAYKRITPDYSLRIGCYGLGTRDFLNGYLSDYQIWDKNFTQEDVTFDYLNPESLALNTGGTLLTNSNLKLWYPMNDGHRGQQSYILDASNTGLGDDVLTNSSFLEWTVPSGQAAGDDPTYWGVGNEDAYNYVTQLSGGGFRFDWAKGGTVADLYINQTATVVGVSYKATVKINAISGASASLRFFSSPTNHGVFTTVGTHSVYFTATSTTLTFARSGSNESYAEIEYLKIEPVNDKNHATTVFYGDEQITEIEKNSTTFGSHNWNDYNITGTGVSVSGGKLVVVTDDGSSDQEGIQLAASLIDGTGGSHPLVVGRTYRVSVDLQNTAGVTTPSLQIALGGTSSSTFTITASEVTYTKDIVCSNASNALVIKHMGSVETGTTTFTVDNISVKEVGTAMGWTDADQQLDIPQTALQSYNQLAWFPGVDPGVDYDVQITDHESLDDVWDSGGALSAWIYPITTGVSDYGRVFDKGTWLIYTRDESGGYCNIEYTFKTDANDAAGQTTNRVVKMGVWNHLVVSNDTSIPATQPKIYINGEEVAVTEDSPEGSGTRTSDDGSNLFIGNRSDGARTFGGCITEVSFWGSGLSADNVKELYNDGKALSAIEHSTYVSSPGTLEGYWKNNGLSTWTDLSDAPLNNGTVNNLTETMLITAGADASRDSQGFLMNRQRTTNSLNLYNDGPYTVSEITTQGALVKCLENPLTEAQMATFSVSFWVKTYDKSGFMEPLINLTYDNSTHFQLVYHTNEDFTFTYEQGGNIMRYQTDTATLMQNDTWTHVVCVCNGSESTATDRVKFYIDGKFRTSADSQASTTTSPSNDNSMWIGASHIDGTKMNGEIDDVLVYTDLLDDGVTSPSDGDVVKGEIARNYNAGKRSHR